MNWVKTWLLLILPKTFRVLAPLFIGIGLVALVTFGCVTLARAVGLPPTPIKVTGLIVAFIGLVIYHVVTELFFIEKANFSAEELRHSPVDASSVGFSWLYKATLLFFGLLLFSIMFGIVLLSQ